MEINFYFQHCSKCNELKYDIFINITMIPKNLPYLATFVLNEFSEKFKKAFQSVLSAQFILCYNLLQVFLSLIFALMKVRNMREKDIIQGFADFLQIRYND